MASGAPGDIKTEPNAKIVYNAPFTEKNVYNVRLTKHGAHRIGWAIKTTNMRQLAVDPPAGVLDAKEAQMMTISCEPFNFGAEDANNERTTFAWPRYKYVMEKIKRVNKFAGKLLLRKPISTPYVEVLVQLKWKPLLFIMKHVYTALAGLKPNVDLFVARPSRVITYELRSKGRKFQLSTPDSTLVSINCLPYARSVRLFNILGGVREDQLLTQGDYGAACSLFLRSCDSLILRGWKDLTAQCVDIRWVKLPECWFHFEIEDLGGYNDE